MNLERLVDPKTQTEIWPILSIFRFWSHKLKLRILRGGGGNSPRKFRKRDFGIAVGHLFGRVSRPYTIMGASGDHPYFMAKNDPKIKRRKYTP